MEPGRGGRCEAYVSTQQSTPLQEARLSRPDEHPQWPGDPEGPARQGPGPPVGLIRSIRDRRDFQRLAADGRRIQRSNLWCIWCPDPHSDAASVAFAIGRTLGPAVARNRLRRRLRAVLRQIDATTPLPPALILIGAKRPADELTYEMIERDATSLITEIATTISTTSTSTRTAISTATSTGRAASAR